jgi:8-oxo-dGTP diphosphatase
MSDPLHIVAVSGLFRDHAGRVLLVETPRRGWECPGGQVECGEDLVEALQRETREETGCGVVVERLVGVYTNPVPPTKVMFMFAGRHRDGEARRGDELDAGWFPVEQALRLVTFGPNRLKLRDALQPAGRPVYRVYSARPFELMKQTEW